MGLPPKPKASARWAMRMAPVNPPRRSVLVRTKVAHPLAMKSAVFMWTPSEVSAMFKGTLTRSASHL